MAGSLSLLCVIEDPVISPSSRLRILNHLATLNAEGVRTEVLLQPKSSQEWKALLRRARDYDAVLWQKVLMSQWKVLQLKLASRCLLLDLDDAVWMGKKNHVPYRSGKQARRFWFFVRCLDGALCGSPVLEEKIHRIKPDLPTTLLPTSVPSRALKPAIPSARLPVIVWVGMGPNVAQVEAIEAGLTAAYVRNPFLLRVVSNRPPVFREFSSWEFMEWSEASEYAVIDSADLGIMPLVDDGFTRGKCAYKALQYMACGLPVVASDVGVNRQWIEEAGGGFVVTPEGWGEALSKLLADPDLRNRMGKRGWEKIQERFSHQKVGEQFVAAVRKFIPRRETTKQ
jgi:glycosyltransferase involved in cell wall biosynthesis